MYFYRLNEHDEAELFYLPPATDWYISMDGDEKSAEIILICHGQSYLLVSSDELINDHSGLKPWDLYDYYNEIVHAAFLEVKAGSQCIDFADLQEKILPKYIAEWKEMRIISV